MYCTYKCNVESLSRNHCSRGKAISVTYSECVSVALFIQHSKRMRRIILSSVAYLAYCIFPHYLINGTIFVKECVCFNFVYNFCLKRFSF